MKLSFDRQYALFLLVALVWTTVFSMASGFPLRGLRNLGILACYGLAIVMLVRLKFATVVVTWCVFGLAAGLIYSAYNVLAYSRDKAPDKTLRVSVGDFLYGPLAWPIMIPEAVEYSLAELGVLKTPPTPAKQPAESATPCESSVPPR